MLEPFLILQIPRSLHVFTVSSCHACLLDRTYNLTCLDIQTGHVLWTHKISTLGYFGMFCSKSRRYALVCRHRILAFDVASGALVCNVDFDAAFGEEADRSCADCSLSADGTVLAVAFHGISLVLLHNVQTSAQRFLDVGSDPHYVAFGSQPDSLLLVCWTALHIYDLTQGTRKRTIPIPASTIVSFSGNGRLMLISQHHSLWLLDTEQAADIIHVHISSLNAWTPRFTDDGTFVTCQTCDRKIVVIDPRSGRQVRCLQLDASEYICHAVIHGNILAYKPDDTRSIHLFDILQPSLRVLLLLRYATLRLPADVCAMIHDLIYNAMY